MKRALVIRYGAFGDVVMITPVLRALKEHGYHVTVNVSEYGAPVLENNPHVDELMIHKTGSVHPERLEAYWKELSEKYDRAINLSGSVEMGLLKVPSQPEYLWDHARRHAECDHNYYDRTMQLAGFPERVGERGELFFSKEEEAWAQEIRHQHRNRFLVLWSLSGSSYHKSYPYADEVATGFLNRHDDAVTFTVGDEVCRLIEWDHPHTKKRSGIWSIRKSFIMAKYADLVVGTETGLLAAAGCFDTPKIIMLSHGSRENLTKHWTNCVPLSADVPCQPCHKLHYKLETCQLEKIEGLDGEFETKWPACMVLLPKQKLTNALEDVYSRWKEKRNGLLCLH